VGMIPAPDRSRVEGVVEPATYSVVHAGSDGFVAGYMPSGMFVWPNEVSNIQTAIASLGGFSSIPTTIPLDCPPLTCSENRRMQVELKHMLAERQRLLVLINLARDQNAAEEKIYIRQLAALDQRIAYQRELRAGDLVVVRSALLEVRDKTLRFAHVMHDGVGGHVAAITRLVGVCVDTAARRACALPDAVRERAHGMLQPAFALPWND